MLINRFLLVTPKNCLQARNFPLVLGAFLARFSLHVQVVDVPQMSAIRHMGGYKLCFCRLLHKYMQMNVFPDYWSKCIIYKDILQYRPWFKLNVHIVYSARAGHALLVCSDTMGTWAWLDKWFTNAWSFLDCYNIKLKEIHAS